MENKFVDLKNARKKAQLQVMQNILKEEHCPFCMENFKKYHKQPILYEGKHWVLTSNQWPYPNTKLHLLLILKYHAETASEIRKGTGDEMYKIMAWVEKKYKIPGGAWGQGATEAQRFGDSRYSGSTVRHIHIQYVVPDIKKLHAKKGVPFYKKFVVFFIGKPLTKT